MTTHTKPTFDGSLSRRFLALALLAGTGGTLAACGGDDITCGAGTTKQGKQCVAAGTIHGSGGSENTTDGGGSGGSGEGGSGNGGTAGTGGSEPGPDGGGAKDQLTFAGISDASPADAAGTASLVRVSWAPASYAKYPDARIHYEIFQAEAPGAENFTVPAATAPPGATSYTFQELTAGKTYYYVVRAVSDVGNAVDENVAEDSAAPAVDSKAPTFTAGAKATAPAGPTSVKVSWDPATDDQTGPGGIVYRVYWSMTTGGTQFLGAVSTPGATSAIVTGLPTPESDYFFRVRAVDAAGNVDGNKVDVKGTTGPDVIPPVFGGCTAVTDISAATATVTWNAAVDETTPQDEITYTVYASEVKIKPGSSLAGLEVGSFTGVTTGKVEGLIPSTNYRFVCRAKDKKGNEDNNLVIQVGSTSNDPDPPVFTGIGTAAPDDNSDVSAILVTWPAATDVQSAASNIKYRVYVSITAGDENYNAPALVESTAGATQVSIPKSELPTPLDGSVNRDFYFVVRAVDEANNEEKNTKELKATTLVSFKDEVQPIFTDKCAVIGCHTAADPNIPPKQGQNLDSGAAYLSIVNVVAVEGQSISEPNIVRVSTSGVRMESYLYRKITATPPFFGSQMPATALGGNGPLSDDQKATLILWIDQGARNN